MNAIQFIKDQGLKNAKLCLELMPTSHVEIPDNELGVTYSFKKEELKTLFESVEIIQSKDGIEPARKSYNDMIEAINQVPWVSSLEESSQRLKQAIADYESIYGGEHV